MKKITVFTTTYNRAHLLPRLYESLCRQTSSDFLWLVVDDGSVDETKKLIHQYQSENKIEIQYQYKTNGGMHTGHNTAYELIQTELNVCIDSDDAMPSDAIQRILSKWQSINDKSNLAGIIGLDVDEEGKIIGTSIPKNLKQGSLDDLYRKHKVLGDKKIILRTDIVRKYPSYPEYATEKLVPLGILYLQIGKDYDFLYSNEVYCIVEYQEEGSTNTILRQYNQSPKGFSYARKIKLKYSDNNGEIIKNCIHLIACGITTKSLRVTFKDNPYKFLTVCLLPFGLLLKLFITLKTYRR